MEEEASCALKATSGNIKDDCYSFRLVGWFTYWIESSLSSFHHFIMRLLELQLPDRFRIYSVVSCRVGRPFFVQRKRREIFRNHRPTEFHKINPHSLFGSAVLPPLLSICLYLVYSFALCSRWLLLLADYLEMGGRCWLFSFNCGPSQ